VWASKPEVERWKERNKEGLRTRGELGTIGRMEGGMTSEWYEREKHESRQDLKAVGTDEIMERGWGKLCWWKLSAKSMREWMTLKKPIVVTAHCSPPCVCRVSNA